MTNYLILTNITLINNKGYHGSIFLKEKDNLILKAIDIVLINNRAIFGVFIYLSSDNKGSNILILKNGFFRNNECGYFGLVLYAFLLKKVK